MLDSKHGLRGHVVSISKLYYMNYDEKWETIYIYIYIKIDYQKKKTQIILKNQLTKDSRRKH